MINRSLESQAVLDGMGQAVLVFDAANRLAMENEAARTLLGGDLRLIRAEGWAAAALLLNTKINDLDKTLDAIRARALASDRPIRFRAYLSGEYVPCWASAVQGQSGEVYTLITIEQPDWMALRDIVGRYFEEVKDAVESSNGHADIIAQTVSHPKPKETIEQLGKRINGFTRLIHIHMHRLGLLTESMERLETIRTNSVRESVRRERKKIRLADFIDDFVETVRDDMLADPESDLSGHRRRIKTAIPSGLAVAASPMHVRAILRDILRNAIMYSMKASPVEVIAHASPKDYTVQIDIIDQGYGIRASEMDRVFTAYMRARQPQIMGEFGHGLSLYLCKHEIEAMGGRIWYTSEEGVGTTVSFKLPIWREELEQSEGASFVGASSQS